MQGIFTNSVKTAFFTILFLFIGLFIFTKLAGPIPFFVNSIQTTKSSFFYVQGEGEATAVPNTAQFSVGVTKTAANVLDAQNQVNTIISKIQTELKALGVEEKNIKTTNYSVTPQYDFAGGRQSTNGYTVTANLDIKVTPADKANKALDLATAAGANLVGSMQFVLDDETKKKVTQQAREEAIKNAKEKAQSLASAAGISLGKIIDVQETSFDPDPRFGYGGVQMDAKTELAAPQPVSSVSPGESIITSSVSLSYETR